MGEAPLQLRKWTIQLAYDARDDNGKQFRARSVIHVEADNIRKAYDVAAKSMPTAKLGAIMLGHHNVVF